MLKKILILFWNHFDAQCSVDIKMYIWIVYIHIFGNIHQQITMDPRNVQRSRSAIKYTLKNPRVVTIRIPQYCRFEFVKSINHGPFYFALGRLVFQKFGKI